MSTSTSSRFSQQPQQQQETLHSVQQQRRASILANGAAAASNATDGLHAILEAIDMHEWRNLVAHVETTFQDEEDNMWRTDEARDEMSRAASRKAFVRPSAPQPRSLPQPHSPQPVGFTSSGAPIYSAIVVPR